MLQLLIPSVAIDIAVRTGSLEHWQNENWDAHLAEAQQILDEFAYRYPGRDVVAGHSDVSPFQFARLQEIKYNTLIIYNDTRYRVRDILVTDKHDTAILNNDGLTLFTCQGNGNRLVVHAQRP